MYIYISYICITSIYIIRIYIISIRTYFYLLLLKVAYCSRFCYFTAPVAVPSNDNTLINLVQPYSIKISKEKRK